jgi:hypothetical protein
MVLIRRADGSWREPETTSYANEKELQDLLKASSNLLPDTEPSAVVEEFWIPGVGSVDLVAVDAHGQLTLVECKLKANSEIRRAVVGQILAYAGGLWRMSYDDFAAGFAARAGQPLERAVAKAVGDELDEAEFRRVVRQNLAAGGFRLIIAVDAITEELKRIVEYLNGHTSGSVQVLALELVYTRDGDVEVLAPTVYGQESAARKPNPSLWTVERFAEQVRERTTEPARAFVERLLAHGGERGHHPVYGSGVQPAIAYHYLIEGQAVSVWALELQPTGPVVRLSLGALSTRSRGRALELLHGLKAEPTLGTALAKVDETTLNKYPSISIDGVLTNPVAQEAFFAHSIG